MTFNVPAAAGHAPFSLIPESTSAVLPVVATLLQETFPTATPIPNAGNIIEIRQVLPECQPGIQTLQQSLQQASIAASNNLAQASRSITQAQADLASASNSANAAISSLQSSASISANDAILSVQSSASSSAVIAISALQSSASASVNAAVASVQSSASLAMASMAASVSASAAVAMASFSLDRNSAASQVAQANQQASDSKLAALNATQTAFAVLGTIVGSSLISIFIYWLVSRRRKHIRRRNKRNKAISKPMSIDAEEKKYVDPSRPSTAMSQSYQSYPEEEKNAMAMASSVPQLWDRRFPQLGGPTDARHVSYFQPIVSVSPLPNFSNNNTSRTPSLKRGPSFPIVRHSNTANTRMSEVSRLSGESDASEWSFIPAALGYQAQIDEGRQEKAKEKAKSVISRRNSLYGAEGDNTDVEALPALLPALSYVDLKSQAGSVKSKVSEEANATKKERNDDDNEPQASRKSSIGTAI